MHHAGVGSSKQLIKYVNVPQIVALLVSNKIATLAELDTVYGLEDAYNMLEILIVSSHNEMILNKTEE